MKVVNKEASATVNRRRGRRRRLWSRSKVKKKPKFLSLKANFPANDQSNNEDDDDQKEIIVRRCVENIRADEIRECHDHENVALFFSGGEGGATTLTGLLGATAVAGGNEPNNSSSSRHDELSLSSASPTYGYGSKDPAALVRSALRSKERDSSEDKWVCYSEVVERKEEVAVKEEEVTSSAVDRRSRIGRLSLKLDRYEEILNAWSDKGRPPYIDAQIVPDGVNNDDEQLIVSQGLWTVPEMAVGDRTESAEEAKKTTTMRGDREVSLLRYKEKRLNRLFSKTIRYQVRKLNAEKRPRLKGRFIKRS